MTKHAFLPTTIISVKGSVFMSEKIKEVAEVLESSYNMPQQSMRTELKCYNKRKPHSRKP